MFSVWIVGISIDVHDVLNMKNSVLHITSINTPIILIVDKNGKIQDANKLNLIIHKNYNICILPIQWPVVFSVTYFAVKLG